jgi:ArsR family transcriptional regulator, arsenate/arsenite/antimonite-responsive transcriptional repressor
MTNSPRIDQMFKSFSDETRLRVLHLLTRGELCVCDIHETLKLPQSKVSRHLSYLRKAGLVNVRRDGLWKHYSLAVPQGKFHQGLIDCLKGCFQEAPVLRRDKAALMKRNKTSRC